MYIWSKNLILLMVWTITSAENAGKGQAITDPNQDISECEPCPPGYAVAQMCTTSLGRICAICPEGTFNIQKTLNTSCTPCSTCPEWYYERTPCTPLQDAVCEACDARKKTFETFGLGFGNEDFLRKCERSTTSTSTTSHPTTQKSHPEFTHINGDITEGDDLATFITVTNSSLPAQEADGGSGDGSGDSGPVLVTVGNVGELPKLGNTTENITEQTTETIILVGEFMNEAPVDLNESSTPLWIIILAAIIAVVVLTVLCVLLAKKFQSKRSFNPEKPPAGSMDLESPSVKVPMIQNGTEPPTRNGTKPEREPMLTASSPAIYSRDHSDGGRRNIYRPGRKPKRPNLKKARSFGGSRDFTFIDEDSDDEMVKYLGRPPSIYFKDKKGANKRPGGFFNRLRRPRSRSFGQQVPEKSTKRQKAKVNESKIEDKEKDIFGTL